MLPEEGGSMGVLFPPVAVVLEAAAVDEEAKKVGLRMRAHLDRTPLPLLPPSNHPAAATATASTTARNIHTSSTHWKQGGTMLRSMQFSSSLESGGAADKAARSNALSPPIESSARPSLLAEGEE